MILEGVFERFSKLRVVMIEGGFAWAPPLAWRLDAHWAKMRNETPHLKLKPSEYMRRNVWSLHAADGGAGKTPRIYGASVTGSAGTSCSLYASDYPHWDFDDPMRAFPIVMSDKERLQIFQDNAIAFYQLKS